MKKIVLLLIFCCALFGCSDRYANWKTVTVEHYGTIKIPPEWEYREENDYLFFYTVDNQNNDEYQLVQYSNDNGINDYFQDILGVENWESITSEVFSNSAVIRKEKILFKTGEAVEVFTIDLSGCGDDNPFEGTIGFIFLNTTISEELVRDIAKSYVMDIS